MVDNLAEKFDEIKVVMYCLCTIGSAKNVCDSSRVSAIQRFLIITILWVSTVEGCAVEGCPLTRVHCKSYLLKKKNVHASSPPNRLPERSHAVQNRNTTYAPCRPNTVLM